MQKKWPVVLVAVVAVAALLVIGQLLLTRSQSTPKPAASPAQTTSAAEASPTPRVVPPLPGGTRLPAEPASAPAKAGDRLHPLSSAPTRLIAGFATGRFPTDTGYAITFKPWGYGPPSATGQTVVVTITKAMPSPAGSADLSGFERQTMLLVMDAPRGGDVVLGGPHKGEVWFVNQGGRLVPTIRNVEPLEP